MTYTRTGTLLDATEFASFQSKDPNWFLDGADSTITDYCGWHIAPVLSCTGIEAIVGNKGIAMLPTLNVVSVQAVWCAGNLVDPLSYVTHKSGWLECSLPRSSTLSVDFIHGFTKTPRAVAEVGYELAATALEKASGIAKAMTRGPTQIEFKEFGIVLSDDQMARLEPYNLRRV